MTREELREIPNLEKKIAEKKEQLDHLRALAMGVSAIAPKVKVQESVSNERSMMPIAEAVDLEREITRDIERLIKFRHRAYYLIQRLKGTERRLMELRYVNGYTWEVVAEKMEMSARHVYRIHGRILKKLR